MSNLEDSTEGGYTASSPEEFEDWFNSLPTDEQKAFMDRITRLSEPVPYDEPTCSDPECFMCGDD